jgi:hypothetical protein
MGGEKDGRPVMLVAAAARALPSPACVACSRAFASSACTASSPLYEWTDDQKKKRPRRVSSPCSRAQLTVSRQAVQTARYRPPPHASPSPFPSPPPAAASQSQPRCPAAARLHGAGRHTARAAQARTAQREGMGREGLEKRNRGRAQERRAPWAKGGGPQPAWRRDSERVPAATASGLVREQCAA